MKKLLLTSLFGLILFSANLFAQTQVPYQGIAINAAGQRLVNQTISLRLSIINQSVSGTAVYVETQTKTTNGTGAYTVQVGQGTVVAGTFASINWMANAHFLKVEMDPAGGANYAFVSIGQVTAKAAIAPTWLCGSTITVNHIAGTVAPVSKTVTYNTITNIPGETSKCWITKNLGADHQATSINDATEASAGWYWQFNRLQGYKHDGTTRTPNTTWITPISENSNWLTTNDPCTSELGTDWRLPTRTEWTNVNAAGNWANLNGPWNSNLKLHTAGYLGMFDGVLVGRPGGAGFWSSIQSPITAAYFLYFDSGSCFIGSSGKPWGRPLRCIKN